MEILKKAYDDIPLFIKSLKLYPTLTFLKKHDTLLIVTALILYIIAILQSILSDTCDLYLKKNKKEVDNDNNANKKENDNTKENDNKKIKND